MTDCECQTWARHNDTATLFLEHHPKCDQYQPESDAKKLLTMLIHGIEAWAADEDGVHPDCWNAYVAACHACGEWNRPKQSNPTE